MEKMENSYEYIVVGAGSAGCVIAGRLAEAGARVLLLEAGGRALNPWLHIPAGFYRTAFNPAFSWDYRTEPIPEMNGIRMPWPRGKVVGGSSAINGLIYTRGHPQDYDDWAKQGNDGWAFNDLLPHFLKSERQERGANAFHGTNGPIGISDLKYDNPLQDAFIRAAEEAGISRLDDFNAGALEGVGRYQLTINGRFRSSAAKFLKVGKKNRKLEVRTRALVQKIVFDGRRAHSVEYQHAGGRQVATARREIILSAGAVNSPQLLQLSGIGPSGLLKNLGVPVIRDLPGVGENLQDHITGKVIHRSHVADTLNDIQHSYWLQAAHLARYVLAGRGALMVGAGPLGLFARSSPDLNAPDLQFFFLAGSSDRSGGKLHSFPGCTIAFYQCKPDSRGWVRARSADAGIAPEIQPNYLSVETDRRAIVEGFKLARRIFAAKAIDPLLDGEEMPGKEVTDDDQILSFLRQRSVTGYHASGTCRMGQGKDAVVDAGLKVHGIGGLRVADASIMPRIVSANTNAAALVIGEKAASLILADRH
jgi:choline dehydrogenase